MLSSELRIRMDIDIDIGVSEGEEGNEPCLCLTRKAEEHLYPQATSTGE